MARRLLKIKRSMKPLAHDRKAVDLPANAQVAPIEVDDPYSPPDKQERIVVIRSIKTDPLAWMHARHQIREHQYQAGRRWQIIWEASAIGSIQAIDTTKEPVDGGRMVDMITDRRQQAGDELRRVAKALGDIQAKLVHDILGMGMFIGQAAAERGDDSDYGRRKWSRKLHKSLEILAIEFGFAPRPDEVKHRYSHRWYNRYNSVSKTEQSWIKT